MPRTLLPQSAVQTAVDKLCRRLDLTGCESEVALALAKGRPPAANPESLPPGLAGVMERGPLTRQWLLDRLERLSEDSELEVADELALILTGALLFRRPDAHPKKR